MAAGFAGQWLGTRLVRELQPDPTLYPLDANLQEALARETELFFESQLREDRSALDLLEGDYTYLNERLAAHYGIPNVYGSHMRRVTLTDDRRFGILGKGGVLMVTSHANRTSPVVRGKWIMDNLVANPPPPPPADIPPLPENDGELPTTVRERLEQHRANPVCASCHTLMDPFGFALENFDVTGRWREVDNGQPVDASGWRSTGRRWRAWPDCAGRCWPTGRSLRRSSPSGCSPMRSGAAWRPAIGPPSGPSSARRPRTIAGRTSSSASPPARRSA